MLFYCEFLCENTGCAIDVHMCTHLSVSDQEPSFQVLSDAEYARQLQAEFNTAGRGRGRERREGGGGGGAGALSDNLARGASILVSAVPSHSLGERGEGEEEILGIRPATRFSAATDTVSYMDWEHLHTPVLPVVDSNVQSTNQDARLQSSLAMGQAQHARSPPPGYTTLFSRYILCTCMCTCLCTCMCTCLWYMYVYMYVYMFVVHVCGTCTYTCTCMCTCICTCLWYMYVYMFVVHVCVHVCGTCTYTCTCTCMCTCICTCLPVHQVYYEM